MAKSAELEFQAWIGARNAALKTLDVEWAIEQGCPPESALLAMHKARYECTDIEPEFRHASRAYLEANGSTRMHGFEWPPEGELPESAGAIPAESTAPNKTNPKEE